MAVLGNWMIWRVKKRTEVEGRVPLTGATPRRVELNHPNIIAALNAPAASVGFLFRKVQLERTR
jgi:hypothetical protein